MATTEELRARHARDVMSTLPTLIERVDWSAERIAALQEDRLRELLAIARSRSPWHAERLRQVDPTMFIPESLPRLPVMTKADLMESFDAIVTDRRLTLRLVEDHLAAIARGEDACYLLECYQAVTTAGSSGLRGVFVFGWDAWTEAQAANMRMTARHRGRVPPRTTDPPVVAVVGAEDPTHLTASMVGTFSKGLSEVHRIPLTRSLRQVADQLQAVQPDLLAAYGSVLGELLGEMRSGNLSMKPERIISTSDPLLPDVRDELVRAGAAVANVWGTSEAGPMAAGCFEAAGMHLSEDMVIIEAVDAEGRHVKPGERAKKVLLTNLYNPVLPLIRYELEDEVTLLPEPCACGSALRRIRDIAGRHDEVFAYGAVRVHPHAIRATMSRFDGISEYQVAQTDRGAHVRYQATESDDSAVERAVARALADAGVPTPRVTAERIERLERGPSGKVRRFVPLA